MNSIFSAITGNGGAVTVVRLSGAQALQIAAALTFPLPKPRHASLRQLRYEQDTIDFALVTIFAAPNSFTGEDCVEFSLHGGRAVLMAITQALIGLGARPAEPGEFSRRAFMNNRLTLLQAEATADLIAAETQMQHRMAIDGADTLRAACAAWRETLRQIIAQQEALIDFPDEDLPPEVEASLLGGITALHAQMQSTLAASPNAERLREGLEFVILGPPNAGKSTLLNTLAGADVAIVSETPGTTRDAISVKLDLGGIPVHITDTAGLRETTDPVENEGIKRAYAKSAGADLIVYVNDVEAPSPAFRSGIEILHVLTKADLTNADLTNATGAISAKTGAGIPELLTRLTAVAQRLTDTGNIPAFGRPRQIACIRETAAALASALANPEPELRGEDLRAAAAALGRLTGTIGIESILDAVFSGFCIGK